MAGITVTRPFKKGRGTLMTQELRDFNRIVTADLQFQITNFLYLEARLLDQGKYNDWLDLFADDLDYRMLGRVTNEGKDHRSNIDYRSRYFQETKKSLITRVSKFDTTSAWAEFAGLRQRHFVSNIIVEPTNKPDEYQVSSYFLFKRSRGSDERTEELFGERVDIIRRENDTWKIASRTIYPDRSVFAYTNLSMFL